MSAQSIQFPNKIQLANTPTPFRCLKNLTDHIRELQGFCPNIWIKCDDQTGSSLSGNKVRKLEFLIADALRANADVVITCGGIQSNHCRATAMACAQLGLKSHLILRPGDNKHDIHVPDGNWFLDTLCDASISIPSRKTYLQKLDTIFDHIESEYKDKGLNSYRIPVGGSNEVGLWGYIAAAEELIRDFTVNDISPDAVVCASGSAGTQGGLSIGFNLFESETPIFGMAVCDSQEYFKNKILRDTKAWGTRYDVSLVKELQIQTIDSYIGPGYAQGYQEVYDTIKLLAKLEGIILDPVYTGKAFYGLLAEIRDGAFKATKDIVFVHSGGTFGLFPHRGYF